MKLNTEKCLQWAKERGLLGENPKTDKQLEKLSSEANEFNDALNKGNLEEAFMEFGDVLVTMIIYCAQRGLDFDKIYLESHSPYPLKCSGLDLLSAIGRLANKEVQNQQSELSKASAEFHNEPIVAEDLSLEVTDVLLIVRLLAPQFDPQKALDAAVEKISNRKTVMINGTAVKEEDFTDKDKKQLRNLS